MFQRTTNQNTATVRTGVNGTWSIVVAWIAAKIFGWDLDLNDPAIIAVLGVLMTVWYRITTVLAELWPPAGFLFFGITKTPDYSSPAG